VQTMYPPAIRIDRPCKALEEAAANTVLISPTVGTIQAMNYKEKGNTLKVDLAPSVTNPDDYDGLLLPGGVANPDELRTNAKAVSFVKRFFDGGKPVAAICHGPWMLVEADVVRGLTLTSWSSLKTDIRKRPTFAMPPAFGWTAGSFGTDS
jgi:protease I